MAFGACIIDVSAEMKFDGPTVVTRQISKSGPSRGWLSAYSSSESDRCAFQYTDSYVVWSYVVIPRTWHRYGRYPSCDIPLNIADVMTLSDGSFPQKFLGFAD